MKVSKFHSIILNLETCATYIFHYIFLGSTALANWLHVNRISTLVSGNIFYMRTLPKKASHLNMENIGCLLRIQIFYHPKFQMEERDVERNGRQRERKRDLRKRKWITEKKSNLKWQHIRGMNKIYVVRNGMYTHTYQNRKVTDTRKSDEKVIEKPLFFVV